MRKEENGLALLYCLVLEGIMGAGTPVLVGLLIFLILFDAVMRKLQVEIRSPYPFMLLLVLARYYDWAVYAAMAVPVLTFITQLRREE